VRRFVKGRLREKENIGERARGSIDGVTGRTDGFKKTTMNENSGSVADAF
jgi:hypothetical protein